MERAVGVLLTTKTSPLAADVCCRTAPNPPHWHTTQRGYVAVLLFRAAWGRRYGVLSGYWAASAYVNRFKAVRDIS